MVEQNHANPSVLDGIDTVVVNHFYDLPDFLSTYAKSKRLGELSIEPSEKSQVNRHFK